jgi:dolichol-phosphate mannosyltransferase
MKLGISIPTYNEASNISTLIDRIKEEVKPLKDIDVVLLVVDDNSPDGTGNLVKATAERLNSRHFTIKLVTRAEKNGYGKACVAGFKDLLSENVDYILQMDADLSHNPVYIAKFINKAGAGYDFVIGSRYIPGGSTPDRPPRRRFLSKYGNIYARFFLSRDITDYTGGFNLYSAKVLKSVDLNTLQAGGYGFQIELKYLVTKQGSKVGEIPIVFHDRVHGQSKLPKSTLFKNLILVPKMRIKKLRG